MAKQNNNRPRMGAKTTPPATKVDVVEKEEIVPAEDVSGVDVVDETSEGASGDESHDVGTESKLVDDSDDSDDVVEESPFAPSVALAATNPTDKLHVENIISGYTSLLAYRKDGLKETDYKLAGHTLISVIRSLSSVTDKVFVSLVPTILDLFAKDRDADGGMFTDKMAVFRIFTNSRDNRGLNASHPKFISAMGALADKGSREQVGKSIDIDVNFECLSSEKRDLMRSIFR